jgi:glycosyltransferase involved in cell wall biosynthesis
VGSFEHIPNVDAVAHLVQDVMPLVWRELPDVNLTVVGADAPASITKLAAPQVNIAGWVEDLGPLLRESVASVAPLRYGAGMKGKVTQSLAAGLPVVTSTIGAEGLDVEDGRDILMADDPAAFADRVIRLHRDPELWQLLSVNGRATVNRVCSPDVQRAVLAGLLDHSAAPSAEPGGDGRARIAANQS